MTEHSWPQFYTRVLRPVLARGKNEYVALLRASSQGADFPRTSAIGEQSMTPDLSMVLTAFCAVAGLAAGSRIRSQRTVSSNLPFSDAVWHGDTLYLSGHIGLDRTTGRPGATAEEEARLVLDGVKHTLAAAGLTMDDLLSVQIFCSDVSLFETFNKVYRTYFQREFPARAFLGSGRLLFDARFEVQGIAAKP
jgi:2-iminobutanoate/2-iminopropanoate deaminase